MQDEWWEKKSDEIETYAATKNSKMFFSAIKEVYDPTKPRTTPLLSADGSTLLKKRYQCKVEGTLQDPAQQTLHCGPHCTPPHNDRCSFEGNQTSSGKPPGVDGTLAEIFKSAGPVALEALHSLLTSIWEKEDVPKEFRNATFVSLFKNRGSKTDCGNYRGISLLFVAGKILARVMLNRFITNILEENLPEAQRGFRPNRSTTDMIFSVRQVQEKCIKQNMDLVVVFIDLTKAFDTVNREALWVILSKLGCPTKFVNLIRQFHDDMTGLVLSDGEASETFGISNGVKHGCVLAPVLFNLFFTCVLNHATRDLEQGVYLRYRLDCSLFDHRRLTAKTKHCLLTTVPLWHIGSLTSKSSSTSLQKPPASSVSPSASARQRSCFSQHLPQLPTDPPSQLMAPS